MAKDFLNIRCPDDILTAIEERVKATGRSRTDVVVSLLKLALEIPEPGDGSGGLTLEERLEAIVDERIEAIVNSINQKFGLQEERIQALEKLEA